MRPRCGRDAALHDPAPPSSYGSWCITFIIWQVVQRQLSENSESVAKLEMKLQQARFAPHTPEMRGVRRGSLISRTSRAHLGHISGTSRAYLGHTSGTSLRARVSSSTTSRARSRTTWTDLSIRTVTRCPASSLCSYRAQRCVSYLLLTCSLQKLLGPTELSLLLSGSEVCLTYF